MEFSHLSSTVNIKTVSENATSGSFEIEGLFTGYGITVGNALRRALLSSLPGAAVTQIKIKNVTHEFSTLPGMKEDIIELCLNFKKLRFRLQSDEPQMLTLSAKGERTITGADIKLTGDIELINPEEHLATLTTKSADLSIEIKIERGLGYSPVESRKAKEKLSVGAIALDAFFSPVTKVNYVVDNMRVGDRTDYDRLKVEIETDGSITPSAALHKAANILKDHFEKVSLVTVAQESEVEASPKKAKAKK